MSGSQFGKLFTVTTFGESHGEALGVIIDGLPSNFSLDLIAIQEEMNRRKPGQSIATTARAEKDQFKVLSGLFEGKTTGTPLTLVVFNEDQNSKDYSNIANTFRPSHGDFAYQQKYGIRDFRGGGRSSGRETIGRVLAGAVAKQFLTAQGISINAWTASLGSIHGKKVDLNERSNNILNAADKEAAIKMVELLNEVRAAKDSIGGTIECTISGVQAGLGEPVFNKIDALLAQAMISLGGVKGIEFGSGFEVAKRRGSENNDSRGIEGTITNHAGGIEAGISNGEEIFFRLAVKPTPSIAQKQETINSEFKPTNIEIHGRHDPTLCPRLVPVVEAMAAIVLFDLLLIQKAKTL